MSTLGKQKARSLFAQLAYFYMYILKLWNKDERWKMRVRCEGKVWVAIICIFFKLARHWMFLIPGGQSN